VSPSVCFFVVFRGGSLSIECESEQVRDEWVNALVSIVSIIKERNELAR